MVNAGAHLEMTSQYFRTGILLIVMSVFGWLLAVAVNIRDD